MPFSSENITAGDFLSRALTGSPPGTSLVLMVDPATSLLTASEMQNIPVAAPTGVVLVDGTAPLTANWDAGAFKITAETFESDVASGTPPFIVASTDLIANLNADLLDGQEAAAFVLVDGTAPLTANWDAGAFEIRAETFQSDVASGTPPFIVASTDLVANLNADLLDGQEGSYYATAADVAALTSGYSRREAVISRVDNTAAPPTEVTGDRYLLDETGGGVHGDWDGAAVSDIVEFNGSTWDATTAVEGWLVYSDGSNSDWLFVDDGTPAWSERPVASTDHGALSGLADDDHTGYSLADGTRWTTTPTASRAVVSDGSGYLIVSTVTDTELGYLSGVTSAIQTQIDGKAATAHNQAASTINSGTLAHERGGLEFDASAVAIGDLIVGTGTGTMAILPATGKSDGDVVTLQADGTLDFETPAGGGGGGGAGNVEACRIVVTSDVPNAGGSYASKSMSVSGESLIPNGMTANADVSVIYVLDYTNQAIYQYDLTTAGDLSTGSYASDSADISLQTIDPAGITLGDSGTKLYLAANTDGYVYAYDLTADSIGTLASSGFDLATGMTITGHDNPVDIAFNGDGTKAYTLDGTDDKIHQWDLSVGWDLTSATDAGKSRAGLADAEPKSIAFSSDGSELFVVGTSGNSIYRYTLSTAWDISTASFDSTAAYVGGQENATFGLVVDGSVAYIVGTQNDTVYQYDLGTSTSPWPVDGLTAVANDRVLLTGQADASENGVWDVASTPTDPATWSRPTDFAAAGDAVGVHVLVTAGDRYASSLWSCENAPDDDTIDTHDLSFLQITGVGPRNNYVATTAPGATDDDLDGYGVGSDWINVTLDDAYKCVDASTGSAVWKKTTP